MNFQDRISTNPGRVTLKNVSTGETATYDLTLADSPTQVGTALNKETFESFQAYIESMIEGNSGPQGPQGMQGEPGVSISNKSFLVGANTQENTGWFKIGTVNVPTYIDYHAKMVITSTYMSTQMPSGEVSIDLRMGGSGWTGTYVQWTNLKGPHPEYLRYYADPSGLVTFYVYVPACWGFYRIDILGESNRDCFAYLFNPVVEYGNISSDRYSTSTPTGREATYLETSAGAITIYCSSDASYAGSYSSSFNTSSYYIVRSHGRVYNYIKFTGDYSSDKWFRVPLGNAKYVGCLPIKNSTSGYTPGMICYSTSSYTYIGLDENSLNGAFICIIQ